MMETDMVAVEKPECQGNVVGRKNESMDRMKKG